MNKDIDGKIYETNCALNSQETFFFSGETQSEMSKLWEIENIFVIYSAPQLRERNHLWIIIWLI